MNQPRTAIFWIANGFDPDDPSRVDSYSLMALGVVVRRYWKLKQRGQEVAFPIIKSIVRDQSGNFLLHEVLLSAVIQAGILRSDIILLPTETTGSPTDGLAVAMFQKENLDTIIEIFVTTNAVARYFRVMYPAVAKHRVGCDLYSLIMPTMGKTSWKSRLVYRALCLATIVAAKTKWTFSLWYKFLNFAYRRRLQGFGRTVK